MDFYIGQIFNGTYPPEAANWCNTNNAIIQEIDEHRYEICAIPEPPAPTEEEQRQKRAEAYRLEKDPITCQITSLRDEEQTPEVIEEINELLQKRAEVVKEIQDRYPYPVE